jgi:hypothetical protein
MHISGNASAELCQSVCKMVSESCQFYTEHEGYKLSQFCKFGKYKLTACFDAHFTDWLPDFWATQLTEISIINRNVPTNIHLVGLFECVTQSCLTVGYL